jgi:hypothetical protein
MQNILTVGDVQGGLNTFKALLEYHWNPENKRLIQVEDLSDRGHFCSETLQFVRTLQTPYPEQVSILGRNYEQEFISYGETGGNPNWLQPRGGDRLASWQTIKTSKSLF